jgi:hypothetical protein
LTADALVRAGVVEVARQVMKPVGEPVPSRLVEFCRFKFTAAVRSELCQRPAQIGAELLVVPPHQIDTDDGEIWIEHMLVREIVEGRDQKALGEIAGCAQDDERTRRRRRHICKWSAASRHL